MQLNTVTHEEHSGKKGEHYEMKKPKDSEILPSDEKFIAETEKDAEFKAKKGERFDAVKQGSSEIWKVR